MVSKVLDIFLDNEPKYLNAFSKRDSRVSPFIDRTLEWIGTIIGIILLPFAVSWVHSRLAFMPHI